MAIALVVLAIGSVLAGYVGVPHALDGGNRIERSSSRASGAVGAAEVAAARPKAQRRRSHAASHGTELALMGFSVLVAFAGIGVATLIFLQAAGTADAMAARFSGLHTLLLNKYYVDELYDATIVQPIKQAVDDAAVARHRRRRDRRHRERRRPGRPRLERGAPAAADRIGARVRDVVLRRRRRRLWGIYLWR